MEALQPRPISNGYVTEFNPLVNDNHDLPPPPTPFPVDLLRPTDSPTPEQRRTVYTNISAIQDSCVQALSALLPEDEETLGQGGLLMEGGQQLASALTELLEVCYELETFRPPTPRPPIESLPPTASSSSTVDIHTSYAALTQHLSDLQSAAQSRRSSSDMTRPSPEELHPAINVVREELAWARVDSLSHAVLQLVRARGEQNETHEQNGMKGDENTYDPFASSDDLANGVDALPPSYSQVEHDDDGADHMSLPGYHDHPSSSPSCPLIYKKEKLDKPPRSSQVTSPPASREKMIRELDAVTVAIERLYAVTPQMLDQRVELRTSVREGWEIERDKLRELEEIWDRIERAHGKRRMWDDEEEAVLEGGRENSAVRREKFMRSLFDQTEFSRMRNQDSTVRVVDAEVARARDLRDRDHFLRDLVGQSGDGRLESQDAMAPDEMTPRQKQQAFIAHVMARSGAGRLDGQDFPVPVDDKLAQRRESFINNIMSASSSGRLTSQDSLPPTPRANTDSKEDPFELVTVQDFLSGRGCSENSSRNGSSSVTADDRSPTALRKIAGMVRRSSLGLGPKATADSDLTHMAYVAEHQEHLKVVQIMLHGSGISSKDTFQLETPRARSAGDDVREAIVSSKQDATLSLRIPLPSPVLPGQSKSFANQDLHLEAKLFDWQSSTSDNMSSFNTVILTATDMRELRPKALCCATCERRIADLSSSTVFKDLPSEHWPEMMEVWICHADPTFTARIARQTKDGFWPTKGTVLVGGSYLLVDGGQTKKHNLHAADITSDHWQVVSCSCGEILGKQRSDDDRPGKGTVRFSKWAIALLREDKEGETVEPIRYPFAVFIVSEMLELCREHASFRFVVAEEGTNARRLLLWLFSPSLRISYRKASSSPMPSPLGASFMDRRGSASTVNHTRSIGAGSTGPMSRTLRVAKVMYKVLDPLDIDQGEGLPGFKPGGQVEQLSYSRDICDRLIATLRESTSIYPAARRKMNGFDVGVLERS